MNARVPIPFAENAERSEDEPFLRRITDGLPMQVAYVDCDDRYRFVNRLQCERMGVPAASLLGRRRTEFPHGMGHPQLQRHVELVLAGQPQVFEQEEPVGGERRTFEYRLVPDVDAPGRTVGFFATGTDTTERVQAARVLERQSAALTAVTEAVPAVVMVVDPQLRYRFVNDAFERWRGMGRGRIVNRSMEEVLGDLEYLRMRPWAQRALSGETVQFERDYGGDDAPVHLAFACMPLRLADGRIDGFVAVGQDITAHRLEQLRLLHLAERDPLTGLLNRGGLDQHLQQMQRSRDDSAMALLYIDLDRFKPVNDQHGHAAGDKLLQFVADRLQHLVRPTDAVARLGGDEFAILLGGLRERAHALAVADKVVAAVGTPFELDSLRVEIGASVGVAWSRGDTGDLAQRADAALYEAKRAGRGVVRSAPDAPAPAVTPFARELRD